MRHAIKRTCSHCQRETYFDAAFAVRLEAISTSTCPRCGQTGALITLNTELPKGAVVQDRIPRDARASSECALS